MRRTPLLASVAVLLTAACDPTGNVTPGGPVTALRFVHTVADATSLEVKQDGVPIYSGMGFGEVGTGVSVSADSNIFQISRSSDNFVLGSDTLVAVAGKKYTMFGMGTAGNFRSLIAIDDTIYADTGKFKLRFVHAVPDQSGFGLDLYITPVATDITGITPQVASLQYGAISSYFANDTSARRLRVTRAGQTTVILDTTFAASFPDSSIVTVIASDKLGGGPPPVFTLVVDRAP